MVEEVAAAGIAAANIGPETSARAQWLLESLKADTPAAVTRFSGIWTQTDHKSAGEWLADLPNGPTKVAAVAGFAKAVAPFEPDAAMEWAQTLPPGPARDTTIREIQQHLAKPQH